VNLFLELLNKGKVQGVEINFKKGQVLWHMGEENNRGIYILKEGKLYR